MATNENARLQYEAGQTFYAMSELTAASDALSYAGAAAPWSNRAGFAPNVMPNGLLSGGAVSVHAADNTVSIAAISANQAGAVIAVNAGTLVASRGTSGDTHRITSLTINNSGALAAVAGTASTAFSETRGAAGGPPYIPVGSIEIGQVRLTSTTAAAVTAAEIFTVPNTHVERADTPIYEIDTLNGKVVMSAAVPKIHTGDLPKKVYASYATPVFTDVPIASDFVPPANSYSVSSQQYYGGTTASVSKTLQQGSFTALLNDGITDPLLAQEGHELWFKFFQDRARSAYEICQGKLGINRTFSVAGRPQAACVIAASSVGSRVA